MSKPLVGIFVGGQARRMGGIAKGLMRTPGDAETLVGRLTRVVGEAYGEVDVVLVGNADAYASLGLQSLADEPRGIGPIGGLSALLAEGAKRGAPFVVSLACDLPFVSATLLERLAKLSPDAPCVAPRDGEYWQPLCARFHPEAALAVARSVIVAGGRSLQPVLEQLGVTELPLEGGDDLRDWDQPSDVS